MRNKEETREHPGVYGSAIMNDTSANIFYLKKKIIFPHCLIPVTIKKSDISMKIERRHRILTYPIRSLFDVILYRDRIATLSEVTEITAEGSSLRFGLKGLCRVFLKKIDRFQLARYTEADAGEPDLPDPELLFIVKKKPRSSSSS